MFTKHCLGQVSPWLCDHGDDDDNSDVVRAACYIKHSPSHLSHAIPIKNMMRRKRFSVKEKMLMIGYEWLVCFCFPCFLFALIDWLFGIRFINWVSIDPITFGFQAIKMFWLLILCFNPLNNPPGVFLIKKEEILFFSSAFIMSTFLECYIKHNNSTWSAHSLPILSPPFSFLSPLLPHCLLPPRPLCSESVPPFHWYECT